MCGIAGFWQTRRNREDAVETLIRDGISKWVYRQVLYKHVPEEIIERPKMGFGVPIGKWLRGPLREWAEDLLSESCLRGHGFFQVEPIRKKWKGHISGDRNWHSLWDVLVFQDWYAKTMHAAGSLVEQPTQ